MKKEQGFGRIFYRIIVYSFWIFMFCLGIWDLFNVPYRSIIWFGSLGILIFVYFKFNKIKEHLYLSLIFITLANVLGEVLLRFFYTTSGYDKLLHFINPIIIAFLIYHLMRNKIENKKILVLFSIFATFSLAGMWEIFEYLIDSSFGAYMQGVYLQTHNDIFGIASRQTMDKLKDTMQDLIYCILGLIIFYMIAHTFGRKSYKRK